MYFKSVFCINHDLNFSDLAEMFPEHMQPIHNASDALKAMIQYCVGASSPTDHGSNQYKWTLIQYARLSDPRPGTTRCGCGSLCHNRREGKTKHGWSSTAPAGCCWGRGWGLLLVPYILLSSAACFYLNQTDFKAGRWSCTVQ